MNWLIKLLMWLGILAATVSPTPTPPVNKEVVIVAAGDISCPIWYKNRVMECKEMETSELFVNGPIKPSAVLAIGDLQYPDGKDFSGFDRSWGRVKEIIYPVPGNHEYQTMEAAGYLKYFGQKKSYSFDLNSWHIIALDSDCEFGECDAVAQREWLKKDLDKNKTACTLAFMHHPRLSSDDRKYQNKLNELWKIMASGGVDVVLAGHNHLYEPVSKLTAI